MSCRADCRFWKAGVIKEQYIGCEELTLMLTHDASEQFDLYQ